MERGEATHVEDKCDINDGTSSMTPTLACTLFCYSSMAQEHIGCEPTEGVWFKGVGVTIQTSIIWIKTVRNKR